MITNFDQMFEQLRSKPKKRLVAAWGVDDHTISAVYMAVEAVIVEGILVGDKGPKGKDLLCFAHHCILCP